MLIMYNKVPMFMVPYTDFNVYILTEIATKGRENGELEGIRDYETDI